MHEKHIPGRIQISTKCNHECLFCSNESGKLKQPALDDIKERITELKTLGTNDLFITGGEPTIHPDLFVILDFAKTVGFKEITIQSNCTNLTKQFLERIEKYGNVKFNVSFHSFEEETNNKLSGNKNYSRIISGLKNLSDSKVQAYITIAINKLNYKQLKDHIHFIKENFPNITHFSFNFVDPCGRAKENEWIIPTFLESERYIKEAADYVIQNNMSFRLERVPLCYMDGFEHFSTEVRMPVFSEKRLTYFADESEKKLKMQDKSEYHKPDACNHCFLTGICPGINPNYFDVHGSSEVYPVFKNPNEIIDKILNARSGSNLVEDQSGFIKKVNSDLVLFKKAIESKPNKNNIYDTYSYYLMQSAGFKSKQFIYGAWKSFIGTAKSDTAELLNLYIHFPFCQSNCDFCIYPSVRLNSEKEIDDYINYLVSEMRLFSPLFKNKTFKNLSIGGGTPSLMSDDQLNRLLTSIFEFFRFDDEGEKSIEFNPNTSSYGKLKILDRFSFNKLSFGVQSLSSKVLAGSGRGYQTRETVERAIADFKKTGIGFLNVDLLLGLKNDTAEEMIYSIEELFKMKPNLICVYPIKINNNYLLKNKLTEKEFLNYYYPLFDKVAKVLPEIAKKYSYGSQDDFSKLSYVHPFSFHMLDGKKTRLKYSYSNFNTKPYSTLGLGYYSESCINDSIRYTNVDKNHPNTLFLKDFSVKKEDFTFYTNVFLKDYSKVKFIVHSVCDGFEVKRDEYSTKFGNDIVDDFAYAVAALKHLSLIAVTEDRLIFNVVNENELYVPLLFFVGRRAVEKRLYG